MRSALTAALAACVACAPTQAQQPSITVDASKTSGPISPLLFGLNHRFGFEGYDSYQPARQRVAPRLVAGVRRAGISWVRYPAGTMANLFRWQRAVGPPARRGCQVNGAVRGEGGPLSSAYGPDEHMRFVEQVGGTASIVVNFATGTPREAANWVRYMNGRAGTSRWADLRVRHGHSRPYGVKWWEVANEPGLPWQDYWMAGAGVGATSASEAERYAFGGTTRFEREPVGTRCDRRPAAALSDGRPGQVKYADSPPVSAQTVEVGGDAWRAVRSLAQAGRGAKVYELDRASGRLRFGDGRRGAIPPRGEQIAISYRSGPHAGFARFYRAMKAADPSIRVCSSYESEDFVRAMGRRHRYDCMVSHPYLFYSPLAPEAAHDYAMAGADRQAGAVGELQRLASSVGGRRIPAAVTEYGILPIAAVTGGAPDADSDFLRSLDHALYTASQLIHFADLRVPLAGRHTLVDFRRVHPSAGLPSPTGFSVFGFAPSFTPSASARVLELFSRMTGARRLRAEIAGNPLRTGAAGSYPALLALASRGRDGRVGVIVVNRDPDRALQARVALRPLPRRGRLHVWTVNGAAVTSFNTPRRPNAVSLLKTSRPRPAGPFAWTFPARSVTALTVR
jgi:alpha-N-arabinofuranosidase